MSEYIEKDSSGTTVGIVEKQFFTFAKGPDALKLESGASLGPITLAYETCGTLNQNKSNAILVLHALTGDAHVPVGLSTSGVADLVVMRSQIVQANLCTQLNIPVETEIGSRCNSIEHLGDRLYFLVVRSNSRPYQSKWSWQPVKHI